MQAEEPELRHQGQHLVLLIAQQVSLVLLLRRSRWRCCWCWRRLGCRWHNRRRCRCLYEASLLCRRPGASVVDCAEALTAQQRPTRRGSGGRVPARRSSMGAQLENGQIMNVWGFVQGRGSRGYSGQASSARRCRL